MIDGDERHQRLEAELAAMRPREMTDELIERIDAGLGASTADSQRLMPQMRGRDALATNASRAGSGRQWADRLLMSAMSAGAIAACVIVTILVRDSATRAPTQPPPNFTARADLPRFGDSTQLLARADLAAAPDVR